LRFAAAEARVILLEQAAARLGVPAEQLRVEDGTVTVQNASGTTATYWELTQDGLLQREATAKVKPKPASEHKVVGKSMQRRDIPAKVTGGASYVHDMRLPGMVFGRVVRPPSYNATLVSFDEAAVHKMPGVIAVVRDGNFLGLAAEREEQAIKAREALRKSAVWKEAPNLPPAGKQLYGHLKSMASEDTVVSEKTAAVAKEGAVKTLTATYTRPYQAHATMGPSCAIAQWQDGKLTVWTHSQGVFPLRRDLAKALQMEESQITAVHAEGAGCYGHNGADDVALDAALTARATGGRPVKLQWMRDDEFAWEPYGSAMVINLRAGLDGKGNIIDWMHELWSHTHNTRPGGKAGVNLLASWHLAQPMKAVPPENIAQPAGGSDRNAIPLYEFPDQRVVNHLVTEMPLRVSALRALGAYANVFALESFMDELAAAANADAVEFRLRHLKDPRARAVIEAAADKAGWQPKKKGAGKRGRGIAFAKYKNLAVYVAVIADVMVDPKTGNVRVAKAVAAADAGLIINPDGLTNQIEGGVIQSTSWTLKEEVKFDRQRVTTRSWADYPILTFPEVPEVEVVLINRPNERSAGSGEGSQGPTAAAIANALYNATGKRLRDLPLTPERVKAALGSA
jgi:nicotinate dehydrogenase subunit B